MESESAAASVGGLPGQGFPPVVIVERLSSRYSTGFLFLLACLGWLSDSQDFPFLYIP